MVKMSLLIPPTQWRPLGKVLAQRGVMTFYFKVRYSIAHIYQSGVLLSCLYQHMRAVFGQVFNHLMEFLEQCPTTSREDAHLRKVGVRPKFL